MSVREKNAIANIAAEESRQILELTCDRVKLRELQRGMLRWGDRGLAA